jgi:hypothetical protein
MSDAAFEKHYRVAELAQLWSVSTNTVTRLFAGHPDVISIDNLGTGKRKYATLSIPASVASSVHHRLRNSGLQAVAARTAPGPVKLFGDRNRRMSKQPADFLKSKAS